MAGIITPEDVIYTNTAGTVRVRVALDDGPAEPDNEGGMPTLRIESYSYGEPDAAHAYGSEVYGFDGPAVWERFAANYWRTHKVAEVFARYVRIFHGGTTFHEYNLAHVREYGYITFDTAAWAEHVGAPAHQVAEDPAALAVLRALDGVTRSDEGLFYQTGLSREDYAAAVARLTELGLLVWSTTTYQGPGWVRRDDAPANFDEYRAWIEGEVFGLILEHKVRLRITKEDLAFPARPWESDESDDWTEEDAVWGIYGDDFDQALATARDYFDLDDDEDAAA